MPQSTLSRALLLAHVAMASVSPRSAASGGDALQPGPTGADLEGGGGSTGSFSLVSGCYSLFEGMGRHQLLYNSRTGEVVELPSGAEWSLSDAEGLDFVYRGGEDSACSRQITPLRPDCVRSLRSWWL